VARCNVMRTIASSVHRSPTLATPILPRTSIGRASPRGGKHGLGIAGFTDQHHFATGVAAALMPEQFDASANAGVRRALQTLLHPEFLGTTFQFLALTKNIAPDFQLSGFKFARSARVALGL
jgi:hypothetical protein